MRCMSYLSPFHVKRGGQHLLIRLFLLGLMVLGTQTLGLHHRIHHRLLGISVAVSANTLTDSSLDETKQARGLFDHHCEQFDALTFSSPLFHAWRFSLPLVETVFERFCLLVIGPHHRPLWHPPSRAPPV
jgi:hypothetical protein